MNRFLEKAQVNADLATSGSSWSLTAAVTSLAWTALYWASENESDKSPMPPPRQFEGPTRVLPPPPTGRGTLGWGSGSDGDIP